MRIWEKPTIKSLDSNLTADGSKTINDDGGGTNLGT